MSLEIEFTKKRHTVRWVILIIVIALIAASGWFAYRWYTTGQLPPIKLPLASADTSVDESNVSSLDINQYTVAAIRPRYIQIPSLNLSQTRIYAVGLDANNLLQYASNIHDVGWYQKSNTPGNGGVILLDGRGKGNTTTGPFVDLALIQPGSHIIVARGDGMIYTYSVVDTNTMSFAEAITNGVKKISQAVTQGTETLNIVADAGTWVPKLNMFDHRVLLRASLLNSSN